MTRQSDGVRVVKLGGSLIEDLSRADALCQGLVRALGDGPAVVVHGGGRQLTALCGRLGIVSRFEDGLRVTDDETLRAALMALAGLVNRTLVAACDRAGRPAIGLTGGDGRLATAQRVHPRLGRVGEIVSVRRAPLDMALAAGLLPVVATLALSEEDGGWLNVNADAMASAIASALGASSLTFLTDVAGVLDADGRLLGELDSGAAGRLVESGAVGGGMRPKIAACREALARGVGEVVILPGELLLSGRISRAGSNGAGTRIVP